MADGSLAHILFMQSLHVPYFPHYSYLSVQCTAAAPLAPGGSRRLMQGGGRPTCTAGNCPPARAFCCQGDEVSHCKCGKLQRRRVQALCDSCMQPRSPTWPGSGTREQSCWQAEEL